MTGEGGYVKIHTRSTHGRFIAIEKLLSPLRDGKAVVLKVDDPSLFKKKRAYSPALFLQPLSTLGFDKPFHLLVSLPPHGSEIIDVRDGPKMVMFARLGLSIRMARAVASAIRYVLFGGTKHA